MPQIVNIQKYEEDLMSGRLTPYFWVRCKIEGFKFCFCRQSHQPTPKALLTMIG